MRYIPLTSTKSTLWRAGLSADSWRGLLPMQPVDHGSRSRAGVAAGECAGAAGDDRDVAFLQSKVVDSTREPAAEG